MTKWVGSHVSAAGGIYNAIDIASINNCNTFAFFLSSPRSWRKTDLSEEDITEFQAKCQQESFRLDRLLPHGNYLINLASSDSEILEKSREMLYSELEKCSRLGIKYYNVHPGSSTDRHEGHLRLADEVNKALEKFTDITLLIENEAAQGNTLCKNLSELQLLFENIHPKDRFGFCIDTCHLFASGHDIRKQETLEAFLDEFDEKISLRHLCAFHLNDSKHDCGEKKDRHENLGKGYIGLETFQWLMRDKRLDDKIFITETPGKIPGITKEEVTMLRKECS